MEYTYVRSERKNEKLSLTYMDDFTNLWVYECGTGGSERIFVNGIERPGLLQIFLAGTLTQKRLDKCITVCNTTQQGDRNG